ncbi:MAG: hypothetical protein IAE87_19790 [Rhodobacteraceae bacterium]|jgi:Ca2+-binding RTX toxin-like protein|nr:hypothetical protein [Paracoccaceae bacterium]
MTFVSMSGRFGIVERVRPLTGSELVQVDPSVDGMPGGGSVVTWTEVDADGGLSIQAQIFDAAGSPLAPQFQVNVFDATDQTAPSVTVADNGDILVAWVSALQDGSGDGVFGRLFSSTGAALGGEILLNATIADDQSAPQLTSLAQGNYLAVWHSVGPNGIEESIVGRILGADGTPAGPEFELVTDLPIYLGGLTESATIELADGGAFVCWAVGSPYSRGNIGGRFLTPSGAFETGPLTISSTAIRMDPQSQLQVVELAGGDLFVAVRGIQQVSGSDDGREAEHFIIGQRISRSGSHVGGLQTLAEGEDVSSITDFAIRALPNGGLLLAWGEETSRNGSAGHLRWFDDDFVQVGSTFGFPSGTGINDINIDLTEDGSYRLVWERPHGDGDILSTGVIRLSSPPEGQFNVVGSNFVGRTLSLDRDITDPDGIDGSGETLQWYRDGTAIAGATGASYTLTADDLGHRITASLSYTDGSGAAETVMSARPAPVGIAFPEPDSDGAYTGSAGTDWILGSSTDDTLIGLDSADMLISDDGNDRLYGGDGADTLNAGAGDDFIFGGDTPLDQGDRIFAREGNDWVDAGHGQDEVHGGEGNDTIDGGIGHDTIVGNAGNDQLNGAGGADAFFGGPGNDFMNGGWGNDRLNGGAGADSFFHHTAYQHGTDWIQDYNAAEGDVLAVFAENSVSHSNFRVTFANTPGAGDPEIAEAFVTYTLPRTAPWDDPWSYVILVLVDGEAQDQINLMIRGTVVDLLV